MTHVGTQARRTGRIALVLALPMLALSVLPGCTLITQRTFVADADTPPRRPLPAAPPVGQSAPALVVIRFPSPPSDWEGPLGVAVKLAVARKPDVVFTVESVVPAVGDLAAQATALAAAVRDGHLVADRIVADGVDRAQIDLTAAADPAIHQEEVRLTVR